MERFLKAKHWQIFILIYGTTLILQIILMLSINNDILRMIIMQIMKVFLVCGFFGWFWLIAIGLQYKLPVGIKMNITKFKTFFFVSFIYVMLIFSFGKEMRNEQEPGVGLIHGLLETIVPLFSVFCIIYCLYFAAKTFKSVELQREVTFSDFAGEFFMIWFFPIGIWIVQPKINKMIENKE